MEIYLLLTGIATDFMYGLIFLVHPSTGCTHEIAEDIPLGQGWEKRITREGKDKQMTKWRNFIHIIIVVLHA